MSLREPASRPTTPTDRSPAGPETVLAWHLDDLIDFEFLLEVDRQNPPAEVERRDRDIALGRLTLPTGNSSTPPPRPQCFRQWLDARRQEHGAGAPLPGAIFRAAWGVLGKLVAFAGLALGAGAAARLLHYDGVRPVNVAAYLGGLVLVQIGLVTGAAALVLLRRTGVLATEISLLSGLVGRALTALAARLSRRALDHVAGDHRTRLVAFWGSARMRQTLYGPAFVWPLIGRLQCFGVCFNLGVIGMTLALVVFSDRAFGWQSAVAVSAEQVHRLVQGLALPWTLWFPEGTGSPTLAQIEGSRIILKDGIRQLATGNLVAWWPFLCLAATIYGLLPRAGLWLWAALLGRRALRRLPFDQVACDRLYERLAGSTLQTAGEGSQPTGAVHVTETAPGVHSSPDSGATQVIAETGAWVFAEPELLASLNPADLNRALATRLQLAVFRGQPSGFDPSDLDRNLAELLRCRWADGRPRIVWVHEAWQPPIAENLNALRRLRTTLGDAAKIIVALTGRPVRGNGLTPVRETDLKIWERQLAGLGDARLRVEALIGHA